MARQSPTTEAPPTDVERSRDRIEIPFFRVPERKLLLAVVDTIAVAFWMWAAYELWRLGANPQPGNIVDVPWWWVAGGTLNWLLISWLAGAYELDTADDFWSAARVTLSIAVVCAICAFTAYTAFLKTYPRPGLFLAIIAVPTTVLAWRKLYSTALRRPTGAVRLLLVGSSTLYATLREATEGREGLYHVLGFVSERSSPEAHCLGTAEDLLAVVNTYRIHRIVVAPRQSMPGTLVAMLSRSVEQGFDVVDFNAAYEEIAGKVAVEHAGDFWLAALPTRPTTSSLEDLTMRLLDVVGAALGGVLALLALPLIASAILIESGRPVLYSQRRLGQGGRVFTLYKFRSMRTDAEQQGAQWATRGDARATRVGRFLRRTHLDELPQLWNVLRGDMSMVGPRPERPEFTEQLAESLPFYRLRLAVRPGLTGLKQIRFGYAGTVDEQLEVLRHDLYYIKHRSPALNLVIIARTVGSVLGMRGR